MARGIVLLISASFAIGTSLEHQQFAVFFADSAAFAVAPLLSSIYAEDGTIEDSRVIALSASVKAGLNRDAAQSALLEAELALAGAEFTLELFETRFVDAYKSQITALVAGEAVRQEAPDILAQYFICRPICDTA